MQPQPAALHATRAVGKRPSLPGGCGNSKEGRALPGSGKHRPCLEILTSSPPQQWAFPSTFSRRRVAAPRKAHWVVGKGCYRSKDKSLASRARASHLSPLPVALAATVPFNPTAPSVPAVLGAAERHPASGTAPCHSHGVTKERMLSVSSPVALGFASPPPTAGSPAPSWPKPGLKLAHTHLFRGEDSKRQRLSLSSGLSPSSTDGPFLPSPHHSGVPRTQEPCTEREGSAQEVSLGSRELVQPHTGQAAPMLLGLGDLPTLAPRRTGILFSSLFFTAGSTWASHCSRLSFQAFGAATFAFVFCWHFLRKESHSLRPSSSVHTRGCACRATAVQQQAVLVSPAEG